MQTKINLQSELSSIIKRKAVGPRGSKHLAEEDIQAIIPALASEDVNLVSKAVLVASVIILERNVPENRLFKKLKSGQQFLPETLKRLFFKEHSSGFEPVLQKILRAEDLNAEEAKTGLKYLLGPDISDDQKSVFLIGERLKRESSEENAAFLQAMRENVNSYSAGVPLLTELADPFDGYCRYPVYTPFTAALLGAMGFPAYCHGVQKAAPKNGNTIHKMLKLAGKNPLKSADETVEDIENKEIGWGYIDQSVYFPALNDLMGLREKIVKRCFLATLEKLLQPLRSPNSNFLVTGFVHTDYRKKLTKLLRNCQSLDRALVVKGMEGSTQIDFRKKAQAIIIQNGETFAGKIETDQINYPKAEWEQCHSLVEYTLETGMSALKGEKNTARKILVNQAVQIISALPTLESEKVRLKAEKVLESGRALRLWQNGCH
jgi:anthranilate phosphoribosyltransferase